MINLSLLLTVNPKNLKLVCLTQMNEIKDDFKAIVENHLGNKINILRIDNSLSLNEV